MFENTLVVYLKPLRFLIWLKFSKLIFHMPVFTNTCHKNVTFVKHKAFFKNYKYNVWEALFNMSLILNSSQNKLTPKNRSRPQIIWNFTLLSTLPYLANLKFASTSIAQSSEVNFLKPFLNPQIEHKSCLFRKSISWGFHFVTLSNKEIVA